MSNIREATKKENWQNLGLSPKQGGGSGSPKLHVKFLWLLFLALKTQLQK